MKKSIPVSKNLASYFTDPCPVLSENNVGKIMEEISLGHDWVIEYGMGASSLYFLSAIQDSKTKMISVENNYNWFEICIEEIKKQTGLIEISYNKKLWSLGDIQKFTNTPKKLPALPEGARRFPNWCDSLSLGPLYRFAPGSKSRFRGKFGPLWPVAKPALKLCALVYYMLQPHARPANGEWCGQDDKGFELILRNVGPSIKDQHGEAPNSCDYINAGLIEIKDALKLGESVSAIFIIDGGPRHKIVEEILRLEDQYKNFKPTIVLCDASRAFYNDTMAKRPTGEFWAGTNKTLKGDIVTPDTKEDPHKIWNDRDMTGEELAKKEVWIYQSPNKIKREIQA